MIFVLVASKIEKSLSSVLKQKLASWFIILLRRTINIKKSTLPVILFNTKLVVPPAVGINEYVPYLNS